MKTDGKKTPRNRAFLIRLTADEHDSILRDAEQAGQPVAWFVRKKLFSPILQARKSKNKKATALPCPANQKK